MNMIELSREEKERSIELILSHGLTKPKSLWRHFTDMYRALGFRHLFLNTAQPIIISVALMIGFIALFPLPYDQYKYTVLFASAPVFFIFVVLLSETVERMSKLYELKMTCKYTVRHVAAFRVLCFSLMGTVLCTLANLFIRFSDMNSFFRALSLSLCALFLFSFLGISVMRYFHSRWMHWAPVWLWMAVGPLPIWLFKKQWESFLAQVPVAITALIAAVALALFLRELQKLITIPQREVASYVGG